MALKKQDAIVDQLSTNPKDVLEKIYACLKNYKHKKSLEDMAIPGLTVKEFLQHGDKDYKEFEYGKPLVPKHIHL
jgi:hypothetical protein